MGFSRITRHGARPAFLTTWRGEVVLKPFSLFFGRGTVYVESDDAVVGNEKPIRARRGQVGWGQKSRPVAAFMRIVARHGAAMARHGRHGPPRATVRAPSAPATGAFGFSRNTRHESRITAFGIFPVPPATPRKATPSSTNRFFTRHETRDTNHGFSASLPTISHDFPRFPGISRPPTPLRRSSVHAPSAFLGQPPGLPRRAARSLLSCALWGGYGAA